MTAPIEKQLTVEWYFILCLCMLAIAVEPMSLLSLPRPNTESVASWFQRSGEITSIFAALAQYRLGNFFELIRGGTFAESWVLYHTFKKHHYLLSCIIAAIVIWGALVWGYGDLAIQYVTAAA